MVKNDQSSPFAKRTMALVQGIKREFKMVKHIEKDNVCRRGCAYFQIVNVLASVDPWIGKKIRPNTVGNNFLDVADTGTYLNRLARQERQMSGEQSVEVTIDIPEHGLAIPVGKVLLYLPLVFEDITHEIGAKV
jgi:hypothetical protein